jgi:hypothetical protein
MLAIGMLIATTVLGAIFVDEGEVVTLTTTAPDGVRYDTQLWIIEVDGASYLRSGSGRTYWLERVRSHPQVTLHRDGKRQEMLATPSSDPALRRSVNQAMAAKYGAADSFWRRVLGANGAVPVRLDPADPARPATPSHPD